MGLSHLWAMVLFAALISLALSSLGRRTMAGRIQYALCSFAIFVVIAIGIAWLMYPLSR